MAEEIQVKLVERLQHRRRLGLSPHQQYYWELKKSKSNA